MTQATETLKIANKIYLILLQKYCQYNSMFSQFYHLNAIFFFSCHYESSRYLLRQNLYHPDSNATCTDDYPLQLDV